MLAVFRVETFQPDHWLYIWSPRLSEDSFLISLFRRVLLKTELEVDKLHTQKRSCFKRCKPKTQWLAILMGWSNVCYKAAAFDATKRKMSTIPSVLFHFLRMNTGQKIVSSIKEANCLELAKYSCVNCHCSAVTMPIKLDSYVT